MEEEFSPIIEKRKKKSQKMQQETQQEAATLSEVSTDSAEQVQASDVNLGVNDAGQQKMKKDLEKPKQKFGLKPLTFFSGLFDLAVGAVLGVLCGLLIEPLTSWIGNSGLTQLLGIFAMPLIFAFFLLGFGLAIMFVILAIFSIISSFKSDKKNLNGLVITTIVFECILLPVILFLLLCNSEGKYFSLFIAIIAVLVVSVIFKIVDLVLMRRREKKYKQAVEKFEENKKTVNFDALGGQNMQNDAKGDNVAEPNRTNDVEKSETDATQKEENGENGTNDDGQNGQGGVDFSALK